MSKPGSSAMDREGDAKAAAAPTPTAPATAGAATAASAPAAAAAAAAAKPAAPAAAAQKLKDSMFAPVAADRPPWETMPFTNKDEARAVLTKIQAEIFKLFDVDKDGYLTEKDYVWMDNKLSGGSGDQKRAAETFTNMCKVMAVKTPGKIGAIEYIKFKLRELETKDFKMAQLRHAAGSFVQQLVSLQHQLDIHTYCPVDPRTGKHIEFDEGHGHSHGGGGGHGHSHGGKPCHGHGGGGGNGGHGHSHGGGGDHGHSHGGGSHGHSHGGDDDDDDDHGHSHGGHGGHGHSHGGGGGGHSHSHGGGGSHGHSHGGKPCHGHGN